MKGYLWKAMCLFQSSEFVMSCCFQKEMIHKGVPKYLLIQEMIHIKQEGSGPNIYYDLDDYTKVIS